MTFSVAYAAILAAVALMCTGENSRDFYYWVDNICIAKTVHYFNMSLLAGKLLSTVMASGLSYETTCIATYFEYMDSNTVRATEYVYINENERKPRFYTMTHRKCGTLDVVYDDEPRGIYQHHVYSYTEKLNGSTKLTWLKCSDNLGLQSSILSNDHSDTVDEWNILRGKYPSKSMIKLPNKCEPGKYFSGTDNIHP